MLISLLLLPIAYLNVVPNLQSIRWFLVKLFMMSQQLYSYQLKFAIFVFQLQKMIPNMFILFIYYNLFLIKINRLKHYSVVSIIVSFNGDLIFNECNYIFYILVLFYIFFKITSN